MSGPYSLSTIIAAEIGAITRDDATPGGATPGGATRGGATRGQLSDADRASLQQIADSTDPHRELSDPVEVERLRTVYGIAHKLGLSALCLSGGGIRSASFALGVLQALAERGLLSKFDYLSTVSGGGYIGSWLSAWLHHAGDGGRRRTDHVLEALKLKRAAFQEPEPIRHLRQYSSFLTPQLGLMSGDLWTAVTIILRNLLLNWLILIPAICLPLIAIKLAAAVTHTANYDWPAPVAAAVAILSLILTGWSFAYKLRRLYIVPQPDRSARQELNRFLRFSMAPAMGAGACFAWLAVRNVTPAGALLWGWEPAADRSAPPGFGELIGMIFVAMAVYVIASIAGLRGIKHWRWADLGAWAAAAVVSGTVIWAGVYLGATTLEDKKAAAACSTPAAPQVLKVCTTYPIAAGTVAGETQVTVEPATPPTAPAPRVLLLVVLGMPWYLMSILLGQMTYVMFRSYAKGSDAQREWLGRAGGWYVAAAVGWILFSAVALANSLFLGSAGEAVAQIETWLLAIGSVAGAVTGVLGRSSLSPAKGPAVARSEWLTNIGLALAAPLFAVVLLILLSVGLDRLAFGSRLYQAEFFQHGYWRSEDWLLWLRAGAVIAALVAVMLIAAFWVNINRFSLHALYRNRLIRAFLGIRPNRAPHPFTGFDPEDNVRFADLWPAEPKAAGDWRPLHVINIALNLSASGNLAWQQRKAMSFTATPLHCGAAGLGFRRTAEYGSADKNEKKNNFESGISLGTALTISGAAVSPNMGYHSSSALAFLLTLLNVRLGWWLGNPGPYGGSTGGMFAEPIKRLYNVARRKTGNDPVAIEPYRQEGPWFALKPLLSELFGMSDESSHYVYLSDGGHFENLGLYEMVRRRCRFIIVSDGGQDGSRGFDDLGNAVRKIWIDLGIRITFESATLLQATGDTAAKDVPYFAVGTIDYLSDEGVTEPGRILYIKPGVRGGESADIIAYQRAFKDFPHQSTGDQWFDEPQLEAYRGLGFLIMDRIITRAASVSGEKEFGSLAELFGGLKHVDPKAVA